MDYHILIVEDDKDIREGIEIYLKNQGYVVFQAADGVEGLSVIEKEDIHLAIVDVMMPRMDGINMMMRVREPSISGLRLWRQVTPTRRQVRCGIYSLSPCSRWVLSQLSCGRQWWPCGL